VAPTHTALTPEVEQFRKEFERLANEADALVAPLSDDEFMRVPASGGWPVAKCIDHLNATAREYLPQLDDAIAEAIRQGLYGEGPFRYNILGRTFVRVMEPPVKRMKAKAPAMFLPADNRSRPEIMAAFRAYQVQFIDRLRQANGLDLARARVLSPVSTWLRIPLGSGFGVIAAHERRHIWQARQVIQSFT
jgi:hypothetical protein